jgi:conjugal transfer/type IV secretion protein DotA/TraY
VHKKNLDHTLAIDQDTIDRRAREQKDQRKVFLKKSARYVLTPGIVPRIKDLFGSGFGYFAHLMAFIFSSVRLIPAGHPYIDPKNIGRFGIHHVVAEAASNLTFSKKNIDQIVIFGAILIGIVALVLQILLLIASVIFDQAFAGQTFAGLFRTPSCQEANGNPVAGGCNDIALMFLDGVFGIPGLYNSVLDPNNNGGIGQFHLGLHSLINFYNLAVLVVGVLIFLYYIVLIVGETAATGTPFGRRFNHMWAPLRLVIAVGFLVPINYGFNSAQYITLFAAKLGSGFATNAWTQFNRTITAEGGNNPMGIQDERLITNIKIPDVSSAVKAMSIVHACVAAYKTMHPTEPDVKAYLVRKEEPFGGNPGNTSVDFMGAGSPDYVKESPRSAPFTSNALEFYGYRDVFIRFGRKDPDKFKKEAGFVEPTCGEIVIKTNSLIFENNAPKNVGVTKIQEGYYKLIGDLWTNQRLQQQGERYAAHSLPNDGKTACQVTVLDADCTPDNILTPGAWKKQRLEDAQMDLAGPTETARTSFIGYLRGSGSTRFQIPDELIERGWGGAAIWYNQIAEWNGSLMASTIHVPKLSREPIIMQKVSEELRAHVENLRSEDQYQPFKPDGEAVQDLTKKQREMADVLALAHYEWAVEEDYVEADQKTSGNLLFDMVNLIFGTEGLFDIRNSRDVHPLAQLSGIGRGMIESAMVNVMIGLAASAVGGVAKQMEWSMIAGIAPAMSSMFVSIATISLTIGFTLYYVLPFLPFIYFFFALGKWVKGIFEAMVGVPLWALAHLKVDGQGLPGESAINGYFLIFEIFIRPILCVFGLIGSIAIFGALAQTLNEIFDIVVDNLTGFDCTGMTNAGSSCSPAGATGIDLAVENMMEVTDEFFFTILYTIIIYIMAQSSFKMIDAVPNQILRWMGAGVQSFGDQSEDAAENIASYAAIGTRSIGGQVLGAAQSGASAAGQGVGLTGRLLMPGKGGDVNVAGN